MDMASTRHPATALQNSLSRVISSPSVRHTRQVTIVTLATLFIGAALFPVPASAADGCLVLLCLAAPSWQNIPQCVDPVRQVLRDIARGRPFPSCSMSGSGNSAANQSSRVPDYCPVQYTRTIALESGTSYYCGYD